MYFHSRYGIALTVYPRCRFPLPSLAMNLSVRSLLLSSLLLPLAAAPAHPMPTQQDATEGHTYPPEVSQAIVNECLTAAMNNNLPPAQAEAYCTCSLNEMQQRYSLEELIELESRIQPGQQLPPEVYEVASACASHLF